MKKVFLSRKLLDKATRLSSIILAVGTFIHSSTAFADVDGIPYNSEFPTAQYPYAQALDGCSGISDSGPLTGGDQTREIRDTWGTVNFTEGCNQHDRCYYTLGSNWNTCNERLYSDLRAACERDLRAWVPPVTVRGVTITPGFHTLPDPIALRDCYIVASGYYAGVQAGVGLDVFEDAQDKQRRYEQWVDSVRNPSDYLRSLQSFNFPGHFIRHANFLGYISPIDSDLSRKDATWSMVPGLANSQCVSFESKNFPGHYLRHQGLRIKLHRKENTNLFKEDATFCPRSGLADSSAVSFESVNFPNHFIRHRSSELWVDPQANDDLYRQDATFRIVSPFIQ